jgi:hypothetical protein
MPMAKDETLLEMGGGAAFALAGQLLIALGALSISDLEKCNGAHRLGECIWGEV